MVRETLLHAHRAGLLSRVICFESRPMLEGRALAARLAEGGIPVTLSVDAAASDSVREADVVLVGVDSLAPQGVIGKLGTAGLALVAREGAVPVYALADRGKIWPVRMGVPTIRERSAAEVWAEAPLGVGISNHYYDVADWAFFEGIVVETGLVQKEQLLGAGQKQPVHPDLASLYAEVTESFQQAH
jgi:translation initiation factor 2B subunit (eIF-2B alpha/beta/delta family)